MADVHVRWVLDWRHDLSATGRYTSVGDVVSLPCINGKPGIHPPKGEGDEGGALLVNRGGEVRVRDRKRDGSLSDVSDPNKRHKIRRRREKSGSSWT